MISLFVNLLALAVPVFTMQIYDRVIFHAGISTLGGLLVGMGMVLLFDFVLRQVRSRMMQRAALRIDVAVGRSLFDKVLAMPLATLEARTAAYWNALFKDVDVVRNTLSGPSAILVTDLPFAVQRRRRGAQHALGALGHPGHRPAVRRSLPRPHRRHRGAGGLRHRPRPAGVRDRRLALGPGRQPGQQRGARIGLWPRHLDGRDHLRPLDGQGAGAGGRSQAAVGGETGRNHRTLHPARRAGRQVHQPGRRPGHLHLHRHGFGRRAGHHGPAPDHRIVDCRQHAEQPGAGALQPAGGLVAGLRFLPPGREAAGRGLRHAPGAPARSASRTTGRTASSGSRTSSSPMARKAAWSSTACAWRSSPAA